MSDNTFYNLWTAALQELAIAREDAERWRELAERWEGMVRALRTEIEYLESRRDTRSTSCLEFRVPVGTKPPDPLR